MLFNKYLIIVNFLVLLRSLRKFTSYWTLEVSIRINSYPFVLRCTNRFSILPTSQNSQNEASTYSNIGFSKFSSLYDSSIRIKVDAHKIGQKRITISIRKLIGSFSYAYICGPINFLMLMVMRLCNFMCFHINTCLFVFRYINHFSILPIKILRIKLLFSKLLVSFSRFSLEAHLDEKGNSETEQRRKGI